MFRAKRGLIVATALPALFVLGCAATDVPAQERAEPRTEVTSQPEPGQSPEPSATPVRSTATAVPTAEPTASPVPTATLVPTAEPTATPQPTQTPTPQPSPTVRPTPTAVYVSDAELITLPGQPVGVPWPTELWPQPSYSSAAGRHAAQDLVDEAIGTDRWGQITAVLIIEGGQLVVEDYRNPDAALQRHESWSVAKSVSHALAGIAIDEGHLGLNDSIAHSSWANDDPRRSITIDHLLRMSSGLQWTEEVDATLLFLLGGSRSASGYQARRDLVGAPGTVFNYSTGSSAVLASAVDEALRSGDQPPLPEWAQNRLFEPIGINSAQLTLDGSDVWVGGYGVDMTARDFARLGYLYLRDGQWDGQQILPPGWVDHARTPSPANSRYGAGFWLDGFGPGSFAALGFLGQHVVVLPETDQVVVVLAENLDPGITTRAVRAIVDAAGP